MTGLSTREGAEKSRFEKRGDELVQPPTVDRPLVSCQITSEKLSNQFFLLLVNGN